MPNFRRIRLAVRKLQAEDYQISVFRCESKVVGISMQHSISKTKRSIGLKIGMYAHWHILRLMYKFRGDRRITLKIIHTFAFFVVVPLLRISIQKVGLISMLGSPM